MIKKTKRRAPSKTPFEDLQNIMRELRLKCPWDKKQTHTSLIPYLREETFETIEAILKNEDLLLKEELGDVLFQVVFHTQLAAERKAFDMKDLILNLCQKMIHRHPHVFDPLYKASNSLDEQWERLKKSEKPENKNTSRFQSIPETMPPLLASERTQLLAARDGFDWENPQGILDKIKEETLELEQALKTKNITHQQEELGDLFFSVINLGRFLRWDTEKILKNSTKKFQKRYDSMLTFAASDKKVFRKLSLSDKETYWQKAKNKAKIDQTPRSSAHKHVKVGKKHRKTI